MSVNPPPEPLLPPPNPDPPDPPDPRLPNEFRMSESPPDPPELEPPKPPLPACPRFPNEFKISESPPPNESQIKMFEQNPLNMNCSRESKIIKWVQTVPEPPWRLPPPPERALKISA